MKMIKIICIGKLKEKYFQDACYEYQKRLEKYTKLEIIELADEKSDDEKICLLKEKERIEKVLNPKDYLITLEIDAPQVDSLNLSEKIDRLQMQNSTVTFLIGGSHGIHQDLKNLANEHLSFSKLTFPHQLFRLLLLEQLYRSYKIIHNEKYHK